MRDYKKYEVWQISHQLTLYIYKELVPSFPKSQIYELSSQMRRAAYSIPMNIAEGCGRNTDKDFVHFLDTALGSCHELEYIILLAGELNYIKVAKKEMVNLKISEVKAKLINLIKSIRKN